MQAVLIFDAVQQRSAQHGPMNTKDTLNCIGSQQALSVHSTVKGVQAGTFSDKLGCEHLSQQAQHATLLRDFDRSEINRDTTGKNALACSV